MLVFNALSVNAGAVLFVLGFDVIRFALVGGFIIIL